ncbi:hypothetical protein GCM10011508_24730 [Flavobacterium lutivivi]|nr:hypothetical protein GCM10011508_24730 [Flavobacterium lutivivi]HRG18949.1 hypothetical protein [Flavobacterium lutivivi]
MKNNLDNVLYSNNFQEENTFLLIKKFIVFVTIKIASIFKIDNEVTFHEKLSIVYANIRV